MSNLTRPSRGPEGKIRVEFKEVVINLGGNIVRALPTRVGDEMYVAWNLKTSSGHLVENVTKMSIAAYDEGIQRAHAALGPIGQKYLAQLPPPTPRKK